MNIRNLTFKGRLALAPMAGVNCKAFRVLCKENGADLIYSQMIDVDEFLKAYEHDNRAAFERFLDISANEKPIAVQIVGSKPEQMAKVANIISNVADIIDINLGCCEGPILGKKAGAYLIKHPNLLKPILDAVVEASRVPVTAKIRSGWDNDSINALEVAKIIENCGCSAIAVHPRTKAQGYSDKADWNIIKQVKEAVSIPVIGSGDIAKPGNAKSMLEQTKCDMVMIGRAARGNPLIFKRTKYLLENGKNLPEPNNDEQRDAFTRFLQLYEQQLRQSASEIRDHALWCVRGSKNAAVLKQKLIKAKTIEEIRKIVASL